LHDPTFTVLVEYRLVTDGQTYDNSMYHASIASYGNKIKSYKTTEQLAKPIHKINLYFISQLSAYIK